MSLHIYPLTKTALYEKHYDIKINGISVQPDTARVSRVPYNRRWPGHQRDKSQTELVNFLSLSFDEPVTFEIIPTRPFESVTIRPESLGIQPEIADGVIRMGHAQYRKIAMPSGAYLTPEVRSRLEQFCAGGGTVVTQADALSPAVEIIGGDGKIRVMQRQSGDCELLCLYNEDTAKKTFSVVIGDRGGCLADITLGTLHRLTPRDSTVSVTLESGELCALCLTDAALPTTDMPHSKHTLTVDGPFTFRRTEQFVIGKRYPEYTVIDETAAPIALGEWSCVTGGAFCGSGIYTAHFTSDGTPAELDLGDAVLDLGDVRHSCEVFLNGVSLGVRVMKPYRYLLA